MSFSSDWARRIREIKTPMGCKCGSIDVQYVAKVGDGWSNEDGVMMCKVCYGKYVYSRRKADMSSERPHRKTLLKRIRELETMNAFLAAAIESYGIKV